MLRPAALTARMEARPPSRGTSLPPRWAVLVELHARGAAGRGRPSSLRHQPHPAAAVAHRPGGVGATWLRQARITAAVTALFDVGPRTPPPSRPSGSPSPVGPDAGSGECCAASSAPVRHPDAVLTACGWLGTAIPGGSTHAVLRAAVVEAFQWM